MRSTAGRADRQLVRGRRTGGVFIVTDKALYRSTRAGRSAGGHLARALREHRHAEAGPGGAGSGTTPTLMGDDPSRSPTTPTRCRSSSTSAAQRVGRAAVCRQPGLRAGRERDRPVADRHGPLAGGREQLRLLRAAATSGRRRPRPASSASTSTARRRLPHRLAQRRARAVGRTEALAGHGLVYTYTKDPEPRRPTPGT